MPSSSREEWVWPSSSEKERVMTMVIFFRTSIESCGDDHGISREEGVWPSSSKRERSMIMAIFIPTLVKSCCGGHDISSKEEEVCASDS